MSSSIPVEWLGHPLLFRAVDCGEEYRSWLLSLSDVDTETLIFDNLPILSSGIYFHDILHQLDYKRIGMCMIVPVINDKRSMPNDKNLGSGYIMIWGDNE